jgi:hypothetical protein
VLDRIAEEVLEDAGESIGVATDLVAPVLHEGGVGGVDVPPGLLGDPAPVEPVQFLDARALAGEREDVLDELLHALVHLRDVL